MIASLLGIIVEAAADSCHGTKDNICLMQGNLQIVSRHDDIPREPHETVAPVAADAVAPQIPNIGGTWSLSDESGENQVTYVLHQEPGSAKVEGKQQGRGEISDGHIDGRTVSWKLGDRTVSGTISEDGSQLLDIKNFNRNGKSMGGVFTGRKVEKDRFQSTMSDLMRSMYGSPDDRLADEAKWRGQLMETARKAEDAETVPKERKETKKERMERLQKQRQVEQEMEAEAAQEEERALKEDEAELDSEDVEG